MRLARIVTPTAIVAITLLAASVASADHRGGGRTGSSGSHVYAAQRGGPAAPRGGGGPPPRAGGGAPPPRGGGVHAVPRGSVPPNGGGYYRGGYYHNGYRPYYPYGRYPYYGHYYPYYGYGYGYGGFYPSFSVGFGLWAGYPYGFSFGYGYPYPYAYGSPYYAYPSPYSNGYPYPAPYTAPQYGSQEQQQPPQQQSYTTSPNVTATGGASLDITPDTAEVYIDGTYAGTASQYGPASQPLTMSPGRHHVEIRAPGYTSMVFDADVIAGQIVPYRGAMQAR